MGTAFGDWNNDGWFDLTVTNYAQQTNTLYHNDADGFFTDATATTKTAQITYPYLGWATAFIDYDNDGYQDLFVPTDICTITSPKSDRKAPMDNAISCSEMTGTAHLPSPLKPSVLV